MHKTLHGLALASRGDDNPVHAGVLDALVAEGARLDYAAALPDILLLSYPLVPSAPADASADLLAVARDTAHAMAARGSGRIVFLLSAMAGLPARRHAGYSVAMATAMAGMRTLAMEFGPNVLVNAVGAGTIMDGGAVVAGAAAVLKHASVPRAGTIEEVAATVLFFCNPLNSYTTGQLLAVDGGWGAGYGRNF